jgi:ABC-type molybdate transport system substrate-binding protein
MDRHGDPDGADLVVFAGGNEWFALPEVMAAFRRQHPEIKHVFYETLPPGVLAEQMNAGTLQMGELTLRLQPDVFMAGKKRMEAEVRDGMVDAPVTFASNVLGLMVKSGNPKHVESLVDLGRADVRVAMPNPKTEGIARQIQIAYRKAGGDRLDEAIMQDKARAGTTIFTTIHHRQTPMWIKNGRVDAGPVWISEALYQERIHSGIEAVPIPARDNVTGLYLAAVVKRSAHERAARAFIEFLMSPQAQHIYRSYGFRPAAPKEE